MRNIRRLAYLMPFMVGFATQAGAQTTPAPAQLEEIIVTAQQRGENLQKAAVAVAVVQGPELVKAGVVGLESLGKLVPALMVASSGQGNLIFIRGVGNFAFTSNSDLAVAYNVDGIYTARASTTGGTLYDVQRIEVLKGPQGTLYGRNATAGAINVLPVQPQLGEFSGYGTATYGNYETVTAEGAINAPLGENAALRVSAAYTRRDSYVSEPGAADRSGGVRAQIKAELSPNLTVRGVFDYAHQGGVGTASYYLGKYALNPATGQYVVTPSGFSPSQGLLTPAAQALRQTVRAGNAGRLLGPLGTTPFIDNDYFSTHAQVDWKTPLGTLTILPAVQRANKHNENAGAAQLVGADSKARQETIEARLVSDPGRAIDYIFGAYYFAERINEVLSPNVQSIVQQTTSRYTTKSPSAYVRLTWHATDDLRFTGGLRYTQDKKDFRTAVTSLALVCLVPAGCPNAPLFPLVPLSQQPVLPAFGGAPIPVATGVLVARADLSALAASRTTKATYRAAVEYDIAPNSLGYASVETGYRAGGFNLDSVFRPETITAFTAGVKNRFLDNRLQLNVEVYDWKYKDQQLSYLGLNGAGRPAVITRNIGKSTIKGVEIEGRVLATPTTVLSADVQYLDAKYNAFSYQGAAPPFVGCPVSRVGALYNVDCSGNRMFNSPKLTVNLAAQQTIPLASFDVILSADTQHRSGRSTSFEYLPQQFQKATWTSNAQVALTPKDGSWSVSAYVRNIENDRFLIYATSAVAANLLVGATAPPRTYGVRLSAEF